MAEQEAERQLVVFDLSGEIYGADIGSVREIVRPQAVTFVPNAPTFVKGVINLRGRIIPIVDLRLRFGLAINEETRDSRVVVVDVGRQDIGIVVDAVLEVLRIPCDAVEPASSLITTEDSYYLEGIAKVNGRLLILLDLDRVLSSDEQAALAETGTQAA